MTDKPTKPRKPRAPTKPLHPERPSVDEFTQEIGDAICLGIMEGKSLRRVCEPETMPHRSTVFRWLLDPARYGVPASFGDQYAGAREMQAHAFADDNLDVADDGSNDFVPKQRADGSTVLAFDGEHVQRSKLRFEARKWAASKILPKVYGDKLELKHDGKVEHPVTLDADAARAELTRLIEEERARQKATGEAG